MKDQWENLTQRQRTILSVTEKLSKIEGLFIGWYYAAAESGNADAARVALDMKRDASIAHAQFIEIANADIEPRRDSGVALDGVVRNLESEGME